MSQNQEKCPNPDCRNGRIMVCVPNGSTYGGACPTCQGTGIKPNLDESPLKRTICKVCGSDIHQLFCVNNDCWHHCFHQDKTDPRPKVSPPPTKPEEKSLKKVYEEGWFQYSRRQTLSDNRYCDAAGLQAVADHAVKEYMSGIPRPMQNCFKELRQATEEITRLKALVEANALLSEAKHVEICKLRTALESLYENEIYLKAIEEYENDASKWYSEGDGYGYNFYMGMRMGVIHWEIMNGAIIREALAQHQAKEGV